MPEPRHLRIIIDSREQRPLTFPERADGWHVETLRDGLPAGDYSLAGFAGRAKQDPPDAWGIAIERKSGWDELAGNLTHGRARFEREFFRLSLFDTRVLVIEQPRDAVLMGNLRSAANPRALLAGVDALAEKYNVPVVFCDGRDEAAAHILDALRRFADRVRVEALNFRDGDPRGDLAKVSAWEWAKTQRAIGDLKTAMMELAAAMDEREETD